MSASNGRAPTQPTQNGAASIGRGQDSQDRKQREALLDALDGWSFVFPSSPDANRAAAGELGLRCTTYDAARLRRGLEGRALIVVARDGEDGARAAAEIVEACEAGRAASVKLWTLAEYGTRYATLEEWCDHYHLELCLALERPWQGPKPEAAPQPTQGDVLLRLSQSIALWHTPEGDAYATITAGGRKEHYQLTSTAVEDWLRHQFWVETQKAPSNETLQNALRVLAARARWDSPEYPVALRIANDPAAPPLEPVYYLDLGDEARTSVRITVNGWEIVQDVPVRFRRPKGMGALPVPRTGGDIDDLFDFVNVSTLADRLLVLAGLTHDFRPEGPYPVKVITGEQGSAKSTTTRLLKRLVDPRSPLLGCTPKDLRDLMVIAKSTWVLSFDNLSSIPVWFSDGLARLSTGGGFSTRKLHTDDEEQFFEATRPVVLNSIEEVANRADLLDRAIVITCPMIPDEQRREEREFWRAFESAWPRILGSILDAVCAALAYLPVIRLDSAPRMADFARWGEAVCQALGHPAGAFLDAYARNRESAAAAVVEDSPLAGVLVAMKVPGGHWHGCAKELLQLLAEHADSEARSSPRWPKGARSLSAHLRRVAPALRKAGVDVRCPGNNDRPRLFQVTWTHEDGCMIDQTSPF